MGNLKKTISTPAQFEKAIEGYKQATTINPDLYLHPSGEKFITIHHRELTADGKPLIVWAYHAVNPKTAKSYGFKIISVKGKTMLLHRVLAITFLDNPHNLHWIRHIDGNNENNNVNNLEWSDTL